MGEPAVTSTRTPQTPNTALYECGHWYSRQLAQLLKEGAEPKAALDEIGQSAGTSRAEVGTAIDFYDSVNFIVGTAAREARTLILGGRNPHLAPDVVREIARRSPPSQESAMDRAALGLHPFARPVPPGTPPDLIRWDHDLDRLDRAKRMLQQAEVAVTDGRPSRQLRSDIYRNALAVRVATAALNLSLGIDTHFPAGAGPAPNSSPATQGIGLAGACAFVAKARRLVEGVTRDLSLAASAEPPRGRAKRMLVSAIGVVGAAAERVIAATRPPIKSAGSVPGHIVDQAGPPGPKGGTYAVVLRLDDSQVLRIGRLGTFWLPAGFLLYVGSAFAHGGVADRTGRHCRSDAPLRWNVDHLKMIAEPVELWWTHNPQAHPVECAWAMTLAALPRVCCPAPQCGANDCKWCPAHLIHMSRRPSCEEFLTQFAQRNGERGPIFRQRLARRSRRP
jgi:Uri superfamily endonuclease